MLECRIGGKCNSPYRGVMHGYETPIATVQEKFGLGRIPACAVIGVFSAVVSVKIILKFTRMHKKRYFKRGNHEFRLPLFL